MTAVTPPPPPPPPGPGVQPPFVAPPNDGARQRRWLALSLAGGAALVICVGGLFGVGGLVVFGSQMIIEQAEGTVTDYLTAVQERDYEQAYAKLCGAEQERFTQFQFQRRLEQQPTIHSFEVGQPVVAEKVVVPAVVRYADERIQTINFELEQDQSTGEFEVCGEGG